MREDIDQSGLKLVGVYGDDAVLLDPATGKRELWTRNDDYNGYTVVIGGREYEFVSSSPEHYPILAE